MLVKMHSCYKQISLTNLSFLTINCYTKVCVNLFTELTNHKTLVLYGIDTEVTEGYNHTARKSDGVHKTFVIHYTQPASINSQTRCRRISERDRCSTSLFCSLRSTAVAIFTTPCTSNNDHFS